MREKEKEKALMAKPKSQDDEVVDSLIVDLRERFYEKGSLAKSFRGMDYDESGGISLDEFSTFFKNLGHNLTPQQFKILLSKTDHDQSNTVDLEEFCSSFDLITSVAEEQGFSNVNTAIGELEAHKDAGNGDGSDLEEKTSEDRDPGASTSHDDDHDDVTYRVQNIVAQLKRKVAQKGSMRTVFREYDANHDGSISRDEFRDALNNLNLRVTDKELDALLSLVDSHHTDNQEIMYDDFCAKFGDEQQELGEFSFAAGAHSIPDFTSAKQKAARLTPKLTELATKLQSGSGLVCYAKVLKAFRDFDMDGAGMISRDDFRFAVDRVSRLGATTGASSSVAGWEHEVDTKGGGYVDYVAFVERLRQAGVSKPADFFTPLAIRDSRKPKMEEHSASVNGNGSDALSSQGNGSGSPVWVQSPMHRPTRFEKSAKLRYKNTSYITCPEEGSPSYVSSQDQFRTTRQSGMPAEKAHSRAHIPEAKAERIRKNQKRIEMTLNEEAARKHQQEAARINSLFLQRQNYLDRVNQASSIGVPKGVRNGSQVGVSNTNILTGLASK